MNYDLLWRFINSRHQKVIGELLRRIFSFDDDVAKVELEGILKLRLTLHARRGQRAQAIAYEFGIMAIGEGVQRWIDGAGGSNITLELKDGIICKKSKV